MPSLNEILNEPVFRYPVIELDGRLGYVTRQDPRSFRVTVRFPHDDTEEEFPVFDLAFRCEVKGKFSAADVAEVEERLAAARENRPEIPPSLTHGRSLRRIDV